MTQAAPPRRAAVCPICGKSADPAYRPFCSRRCADVDLQRWLAGVYAAPGEAAEPAQPKPLDDDDGQ